MPDLPRHVVSNLHHTANELVCCSFSCHHMFVMLLTIVKIISGYAWELEYKSKCSWWPFICGNLSSAPRTWWLLFCHFESKKSVSVFWIWSLGIFLSDASQSRTVDILACKWNWVTCELVISYLLHLTVHVVIQIKWTNFLSIRLDLDEKEMLFVDVE